MANNYYNPKTKFKAIELLATYYPQDVPKYKRMKKNQVLKIYHEVNKKRRGL